MRDYDEEEAKKLNAEQWQIDLLKLNPSYVHWGPHEDYMWKDGQGWDSAVFHKTWSEFGPWELDEYNEIVNFYFSVRRESKECEVCGGDGYHPLAQPIANSFYAHMNPRGEHWNDKLTQDELQALIDKGRVKPEVTLAEINASNGHDAINRWILVSTRLKRLGIPQKCDCCGGDGTVYTAPSANVSLTLWVLHPRKGCSRGVEIQNIEQTDLPAIYKYLREAAERNAKRFSKIPAVE
jgi:hypothetical protein